MNRIIDCFLFFQEIDLLEIRLKYLYDTVDKFLIVEAAQSFTGLKKEFLFEKNKERFKPYLDKITYLKIENIASNYKEVIDHLNSENIEVYKKIKNILESHIHYDKKILWWVLDSYHRECIHIGLSKICTDDDLIILSDIDEFPKLDIVKKIKYSGINNYPIVFKQLEFKYYLNLFSHDNWHGSIISPFKYIKKKSLNELRINSGDLVGFNNAGYHFTSAGGLEMIKKKIESWGHQEYNIKEVKDNIELNIRNGKDIFYRFGQVRSRIIDLKNNQIFDNRIVDILNNYPNLTVNNLSKETFSQKLKYKNIQLYIYFLKVYNNPNIIIQKIKTIIFKTLFSKG